MVIAEVRWHDAAIAAIDNSEAHQEGVERELREIANPHAAAVEVLDLPVVDIEGGEGVCHLDSQLIRRIENAKTGYFVML